MLYLFYFLCLLYSEVLFKVFTTSNFSWSIVSEIIYLLFITAVLYLINTALPKKIARYMPIVIGVIFLVYYSIESIYFRTFNTYFSYHSLSLADQVTKGQFTSDLFAMVSKNIFVILFYVLVVIVSVIYSIFFYSQRKFNYKGSLLVLLLCLGLYGLFVESTLVTASKDKNSNLYFFQMNNDVNKETFGAMPSLFIELRKGLTGFEEQIIVDKEIIFEEIEITTYNKQIMDIDFDKLIKNDTDSTLKLMDNYFKTETYTMENDYTGYFEGKNLILFMAESFSGYVVDPSLTPTLYKLVNNGFVFNNFYTPTILSTIGGEFQELTSLYPYLRDLSFVWRVGNNSFPLGIANLFKNENYSVRAYHNNQYNFQDRNIYLKSLGFDSYCGCCNGSGDNACTGFEDRGMSCSPWPSSDIDLINYSFDDYINDEHFFTYYVTVSGHMPYNFTSNNMSIKNKELVDSLNYSDDVKAYIASQIELDRALELLLEKLEASGKLNDTVIALVGDHYPYAFDLNQMRELAGKDIDGTIEINRSNFILYCAGMEENVYVDKVVSQLDVMPTLYNLFDLEYDSRLLIGKDGLSSTTGIAIFANRSWVTDKGYYDASKNKFTSYTSEEVNQTYIDRINKIVNNRILMSRYILEYDYYKHVFKE